MSEETKGQKLPEENTQQNIESQEETEKQLNNLSYEDHQIIESEEIHEEKTGDQIVDEIRDQLAHLSEKEHKRIEFDTAKLKNYSLRELTDEFKETLEKYPVQKVKHYLETIKSTFDDKFYTQKEEALNKYLDSHESERGFYFRSPEKDEFQALYREFKRRLKDAAREYRQKLEENKKAKEEIVNQIKELILNNTESLDYSTISKKFNELKNKWFSIAPVPKQDYNHLFKTFDFWVQKYYEYIQLNKEYLEKLYEENLREKQKIIERAKELLEKEDVLEAFRELQFLHKMWKEKTGPVAPEIKEEIWNEFKTLTKQIHDKRREYIAKLREQYEKNLEKKKELIARLDEILQEEVTEHRRWQELIKEVEDLKEAFKNAGFVPRKYRDAIRDEFYGKVRQFNKTKNAFYKALKEKQKENLARKKELIEQAKALSQEEDIKAAYEKCQQLKEQWRSIGFVPKRISDAVWQDFKEACDAFYIIYREKMHQERDAEYQNYLKKKEYLAKLKADIRENKIEDLTIEKIKEFLDEWKELGHVPENVRFINTKFHKFINSLFYRFNLNENELRLMQYKNMIENWLAEGDIKKIKKEINFVRNKIAEIEDEIKKAETNLQFFKVSDENNYLLKQLKQKIEKKKKQLELWKEKLQYLKSLEL